MGPDAPGTEALRDAVALCAAATEGRQADVEVLLTPYEGNADGLVHLVYWLVLLAVVMAREVAGFRGVTPAALWRAFAEDVAQ